MSAQRNLELALSAAEDYAREATRVGSNHAICIQLSDDIDHWVGRYVDGKWTLPYVVRAAMSGEK